MKISNAIRHILTCLMMAFSATTMAESTDTKVLILIHSENGGTYELAKEIAKGVELNKNTHAIIKLVKKSSNPKLVEIPVATIDELTSYDGIAFGSPVYFGNISTAMSEFLSKTVDLWTNHSLEGMPATAFMSAGSGAGKELALQAFLNSLSVHGMVLVTNGIRGYEKIDKSIPQGNSVLGTTSLASLNNIERPTKDERVLAQQQGTHFGKVAKALSGTFEKAITKAQKDQSIDIRSILDQKNIKLPAVPKPAGNYQPYVKSGNLVFINQYALKDGAIVHPGKLGVDINEQQIKEATKVTMLNVLAVLNQAVNADLNKVTRCVQLTGIFNTPDSYTKHADLMNTASDLTGEIFGERGKHARGTLGASSLPGNSPVVIQAIFEIEN